MLTSQEIESLRRDKEESGAWLVEKMRESRLERQAQDVRKAAEAIPRMLTQAEIEALRLNKQEVARIVKALIKV